MSDEFDQVPDWVCDEILRDAGVDIPELVMLGPPKPSPKPSLTTAEQRRRTKRKRQKKNRFRRKHGLDLEPWPNPSFNPGFRA